MGNQESKQHAAHQQGSANAASAHQRSQSSHASSSSTWHHSNAAATATKETGSGGRAFPNRRGSIHTGISASRTTASPSTSIISATAAIPNSSTKSSASDYIKTATQHQHSLSEPPPLSPNPPPSQPVNIGGTPSSDAMGNSSSKSGDRLPERPAKREKVTPPSARAGSHAKPIEVPAHPPAAVTEKDNFSPIVSNQPGFVDGSYQFPTPSQFSRPPRLPLPIEQEVHTPGSPIISPADISAPIGPIEGEVALPRRTSVLSSTTVDDEDLGDDVTTLEGGLATVPTTLEWREDGEKVYVTGTFAGWDKKFRLHKDGPSKHPGALSARINLQPGTHHVRFIVDNDMRLSKFMPTAVDYTNFLVNYIEVLRPGEGAPRGPPKTMTPVDLRHMEFRIPEGLHPPQVLPPTPDLVARVKSETPKAAPKDVKASSETLASAIKQEKMAPIAVMPPKKYHREIPRYLLDIDNEDDPSVYGRASAVLGTLPQPPSLPMFLGKSVLNGTTPMKDDASVLVLPNHTVLNHLATSSIKNKVLATSATTRYKRKFLTTIMYKPTTTGD